MVLLFYKYVRLENPAEIAAAQRRLCHALRLKGRILVAHEGINGTLAGSEAAVEAYQVELRKDVLVGDVVFKTGHGDADSFPRLTVKVRKEIVSLGLSEDVDPSTSGVRLAAAEWKNMVADEDVAVVDVRNRYEFEVGRFEGAINAGIEHFRELPEAIERLAGLKEKKVLMYCTGGVRCEKASALFKRSGFKRVYQLEGGILSYLQAFPDDDQWVGDCFVFDQRMVDPATTPRAPIGRCEHTGQPTRNFVNCLHDPCHRLFLVAAEALAHNPELALCPHCRATGLTVGTADCLANRPVLKKRPTRRRTPRNSGIPLIPA